MAFSMSYDAKPEGPVKKEAAKAGPAKAGPAKPVRTGRANRPNSPQAKAEALFEKRPEAAKSEG